MSIRRWTKVGWRARVSPPAALLVLSMGLQACGAQPMPHSSPDRSARARPQQSAHFALLRTPPEGLPATVRRVLRAPTVGMDWSRAQRIAVALPGSYWLVPADGYLCIVARPDPRSPGVGTTCTPTAQAIGHGVATVMITPPGIAGRLAPSRLIVGVAPDGVRAVLVHTRGAVAKVPVLDAVFVRRDAVAAPPDFLTLRGTAAR